MSFQIRSIDDCVAAFSALEPNAELKEQGGRDRALRSWAFADLGSWPSDPPVVSLYQFEDPFRYAKSVMEDPDSLMGFGNFQAIGGWNAHGTGRWAHGEGWIVLDVDLVQEQAEDDEMLYDSPGGNVALVLSLWKVEEGWACAVWNGNRHESFTQVLGFNPWNESKWETCRVWHGE